MRYKCLPPWRHGRGRKRVCVLIMCPNPPACSIIAIESAPEPCHYVLALPCSVTTSCAALVRLHITWREISGALHCNTFSFSPLTLAARHARLPLSPVTATGAAGSCPYLDHKYDEPGRLGRTLVALACSRPSPPVRRMHTNGGGVIDDGSGIDDDPPRHRLL